MAIFIGDSARNLVGYMCVMYAIWNVVGVTYMGFVAVE